MNQRLPVPKGTVGAIAELAVSVDLLRRGYEVFRALSSSCSCDLAILKDSRLLRIEVRTAYKLKTGELTCPMHHKADVLAKFYAADNLIIYDPPLEQVANFKIEVSA